MITISLKEYEKFKEQQKVIDGGVIYEYTVRTVFLEYRHHSFKIISKDKAMEEFAKLNDILQEQNKALIKQLTETKIPTKKPWWKALLNS